MGDSGGQPYKRMDFWSDLPMDRLLISDVKFLQGLLLITLRCLRCFGLPCVGPVLYSFYQPKSYVRSMMQFSQSGPKRSPKTSIENKVDVHMKFGNINEINDGNGVSGGGL